jgi:hypothetical protein
LYLQARIYFDVIYPLGILAPVKLDFPRQL